MVNVYLLQSNLSRTATLDQRKVTVVERWSLWGCRGVIRQNFVREYNMFIVLYLKNYVDRGVVKLIIEAYNTLRDHHNSSDDTKAEFNNCFIIHS